MHAGGPSAWRRGCDGYGTLAVRDAGDRRAFLMRIRIAALVLIVSAATAIVALGCGGSGELTPPRSDAEAKLKRPRTSSAQKAGGTSSIVSDYEGTSYSVNLTPTGPIAA